MANIECLTELACITCPLKPLRIQDAFATKELIERVLDSEVLEPNASVDEVVREVKDSADIAEKGDYFAGIAIGAIAYRLTGRCPQFTYKNKVGE